MMQRGEATSLGQVCTRAAPVRGPQPCGERSPPLRGGRAGVGGGEGRAADRGARMSASPTQALSDIMGALWLAVPKKRVSRARRAMRKSVPTLPASHRPLLCARAAVATLLPLACAARVCVCVGWRVTRRTLRAQRAQVLAMGPLNHGMCQVRRPAPAAHILRQVQLRQARCRRCLRNRCSRSRVRPRARLKMMGPARWVAPGLEPHASIHVLSCQGGG